MKNTSFIFYKAAKTELLGNMGSTAYRIYFHFRFG